MAHAPWASYLDEWDNADKMTETNRQAVTGNTLDLATYLCAHAVGVCDYTWL